MTARNSMTGGETLAARGCLDELAASVHARVAGAFERLVEQFERPLFNYAVRLLRDAADAQEVVQDTFLRAHRALTRQYSSERCQGLTLRPWLFRIARNLSLNKRRGLRRQLELPIGVRDETAAPALLDPVDPAVVSGAVEQREERERLERALAELPLESRELVVLRFIEEMSYAEIATTTGQTEAALRGKVFRALKLLRDLLARDDAGGGQVPGQAGRQREGRRKGAEPIRQEGSHAM